MPKNEGEEDKSEDLAKSLITGSIGKEEDLTAEKTKSENFDSFKKSMTINFNSISGSVAQEPIPLRKTNIR